MSLFSRILQIEDLNEIFEYESKKLVEIIPDEALRAIESWNARWRKESLEHYLPIGWSFLVRDQEIKSTYSNEGLLAGYFIAQPFIFFDGQTQSLWVEHISYSSLEARDQLCDIAYKLAREKHLQRVFFPNQQGVANSIQTMKAEIWHPSVYCVKTTKA